MGLQFRCAVKFRTSSSLKAENHAVSRLESIPVAVFQRWRLDLDDFSMVMIYILYSVCLVTAASAPRQRRLVL
jgi:hypothetical protein